MFTEIWRFLHANDVNLKSHALGQGWRLGFLGTLHMDVFRQRLENVIYPHKQTSLFVT